MAEKITYKLKSPDMRSTYAVEVTADQVIVPNNTNTDSEILSDKLEGLTPVYHSITPNAAAPKYAALWFNTISRTTTSTNGKW